LNRGKLIELYNKVTENLPNNELKQLVAKTPHSEELPLREQLRALITNPPSSLPRHKLLAAELRAIFLDSHLTVRHEHPSDCAEAALANFKPLFAAQDKHSPLQYSNRYAGAASLLHAHEVYQYPVGALLMRKAAKGQIPAVMNTTHHDGVGWCAPLIGRYIQATGAGGGEVHTDYVTIPCRSLAPDILWTDKKNDKQFWKSCFTRLQQKGLRSDANVIMVVEDGYNGILADDNLPALRRTIRDAFNETIGLCKDTQNGFAVQAYTLRFASSFSTAYRAFKEQKLAGVVSDLFMTTRRDVGLATLTDIFSHLKLLSPEQLECALRAISEQRESLEARIREIVDQRAVEA
jgi:hypothetical protein